jgi:hypothetical protein
MAKTVHAEPGGTYHPLQDSNRGQNPLRVQMIGLDQASSSRLSPDISKPGLRGEVRMTLGCTICRAARDAREVAPGTRLTRVQHYTARSDTSIGTRIRRWLFFFFSLVRFLELLLLRYMGIRDD